MKVLAILVLSVMILVNSNQHKEIIIIEKVKISDFGELADVKKSHRALVIAIAATESNCNYRVVHPDRKTIGVGGIKPDLWDLQHNPNSLLAIEEIVTALEKREKSPYEIIKFYKGAKTNMKSTNQCFDLYERLKGIL
jgi:hypothetical protein